MSLLPNISYANTNTPIFLLANISSLNVNGISTNTINAAIGNISSIAAQYIYAPNGEINEMITSTISTTQLDLDGQTLNATPTELLLNGIPIATASNLSTIADWALDPAISSINADGFDVLNANYLYGSNVSTINVRAQSVFTNNLFANNIFAFSTYTSTISSLAEVADFGYIGHLSSGNAYIGNLSSITGAFSSITADNALLSTMTISTLSAQSIQVSSFTSEVGQVSSLFISSINNNEINSSSITVNVVGVSSLVANSISSVGAEIRQALMSSIVFSPSLNPSLGGVNVNLGLGGILGNVIGWGAGVFGAAAGTVGLITGITALATGRQTGYTTPGNFELVNTQTQLQLSTLGSPFSTIYRYVSSINPEQVPGEEIFISTIHPGGLAIRSFSDPMATLSSPTSTIQSFGQWVSLGDTLDVADWALYPAVSTIQGSNANISTITGFTNFTTIMYASTIENISSGIDIYNNNSGATISLPFVGGINIDPYGTLYSYNQLQSTIIDGGDVFMNDVHQSTTTANFSYASTISTCCIQGAHSDLFGIGIKGLEIQAANVWISSPQTNIAGLANCSTVGAFIFTGQQGNFSTLNVSSINIAQQGAFGLSTLMYVSTAQISGTGTSTCMYVNTDVSLIQNDLYCQQVRVGYGNTSSQPSEIIMYAPNTSAISLNVGNVDKTVRIQSTINATNGGYILDTLLNPPFFSTINQSTAMMAYFPSTTANTIGISTLSFIPPIQYVGSWYSSTSQTVAGANTQTPLTYNSQSINVGGFTYSGSTITVPVAGVYEITHSIQFDTTTIGTQLAYFWLKKNGTDIPQTNSIVSVTGQGETLGTISILDVAAANDAYGVTMYSADANMTAQAFAAGATPAIPSLITNIKRL